MIAACPQCQTRFRLAREKIGPQGARIRCSQCQTVFRVQAPDGAGVATPAEARPSPIPQSGATPPAALPTTPKPLPPLARALIAEMDAELAKSIADLLTSWRISTEVVEDGADALLEIFRNPPQLAILGAGLASFTTPRLVEVVRRAAPLSGVKLIQVAVADEPPASGYEADAMLEPADLPAGLGAILERLGIGAKPTSVSPRPGGAASPAPVAEMKPVSAAPAPARPLRPTPSSDPDIAAAERLARIAVSDVILYNEAKFATAAAAGNATKALAAELEEARQHFNSRVSPILRQNRDFLREELERRAALRKS